LTRGFAIVQWEALCVLRVTVDTSQHGEQFADMALSICAASSAPELRQDALKTVTL
jgi:hypothetical protein